MLRRLSGADRALRSNLLNSKRGFGDDDGLAGYILMIGRLLLSDIVVSMRPGAVYFLLWLTSNEMAKLVRRFIFFFLLIFLVRQFLVDKKHLEMDALSAGLWLSPYLFFFFLGTLMVALIKKFSLMMRQKYRGRSRPMAFETIHLVPKAKMERGVQSVVVSLLYFPLVFLALWFIFGDLPAALLAQLLLTLIIVSLFSGARIFGASVWALHRQPIWGPIEALCLFLYFALLIALVTMRSVEANAGAFILIILLPRQLFSSLITAASISVSLWYPKGCIR